MEAVEVTLPGGIALNGGWRRRAGLRPLSGREEAFLFEEGRSLLPAARTTELLSRCLCRLGPLSPVAPETVAALTVGDREALLLHLRRVTLGDRISCVLGCPNRQCGEKMDLDLSVGNLLLPPYGYETSVHEAALPGEPESEPCLVRFRLPTGADQEAAAPIAFEDVNAAASLILRRCLQDGGSLPPPAARALALLMAELDPQAEVRLNLTCPACGARFTAPFDTAQYFYQEISGAGGNLYREVHLLAFHYHWSEAEILGMTGRKRRRYLDLLAEALAGGRSR